MRWFELWMCDTDSETLGKAKKKKKKIQYSASHNLFWTGTVSSVSHYTAKWIVCPCGMNFTMTLCLSQNMEHKLFSVEIVCLNLLIFWDSRCFYCIECHFDSCVLKDAHVSSPVPAYVWILSPCSVKKFQNTYVFCKKKKKKKKHALMHTHKLEETYKYQNKHTAEKICDASSHRTIRLNILIVWLIYSYSESKYGDRMILQTVRN